jgi:hypothetical protein
VDRDGRHHLLSTGHPEDIVRILNNVIASVRNYTDGEDKHGSTAYV